MTGGASGAAGLAPARGADWAATRTGFRWAPPERLNIAETVSARWARAAPDRLAIRHIDGNGARREWSFADLDRAANRMANVLAAQGVGRGDRVAILLSQSPEVAALHVAVYKLAAIAVPLFTLFGEDGLRVRLADSGARALATDLAQLPKIVAIRADLPALETVLCIDGAGANGALDLGALMERASDARAVAQTGPDDPALISYTSGTTGPPKGALHGHRVIAGHLPGFAMAHEFAPAPGDLMWTPADWAWLGGLANALLPALHHGIPVISHRMEKFDPEYALDLIARQNARNLFLPPTALKLMRTVPRPRRFGAAPRTIGSAGEAMGAEVGAWGRSVFGRAINEFYGQTECNMVLSTCAALEEPAPGSTGRPTPGFDVAILDAAGRPAAPGATGEIAVRRGAPSMFLGYWNQEAKTAARFTGDWMTTGDEGWRDPEGRFFFSARADDVITSSGYRIGPGEIEECLAGHPSVAMVAVIGAPDPIRTESVTAVVVVGEGVARDDALAAALIARVRLKVSPHAAPRRVIWADTLPMTATGKIRRGDLRRDAVLFGAAEGDAGDD